MSSPHKQVKVDESHKRKLPETVQYYNKSKVGVDVLDQMARYHTCKSSSRQWPVAVFFNILDCAASIHSSFTPLLQKQSWQGGSFYWSSYKSFASQKMAWIHQLHAEFQLKHPVLQTLSRFQKAEKEENVKLYHVATIVIVITFYSPSCLGQETAKWPFGLRVKLPPAHLSTTHDGGFTLSL